MGNFNNKSITNKGLELLSAAMAGGKLEFTRIVMGSGTYRGDIGMIESLVNQKQSLDIKSITKKGSQVILSTTLLQSAITEDFYWKEIGVYAKGSDGVEVLYMYGSATDISFISKDMLNEKMINVGVLVSNAQNVSATIDGSLVYLSRGDLEEHNVSESSHNDIREQVKQIQSQVESLDISWSGITGKPPTFPPSEHTHTKSQITDFPTSLPANGGNADTVDGLHSHQIATVNEAGVNHGQAFLAQLRYNVHKDNRFKLELQGGVHPTRVDYASDSERVNGREFIWQGQSGQPTWVWGANEPGNKCFVWNPATFSVRNSDTVKGRDLCAEVDSLKSSVSSGKNAIASAITAKGVPATGSDSHATLANKINQITTAPTSMLGNTGEYPLIASVSKTTLPTQEGSVLDANLLTVYSFRGWGGNGFRDSVIGFVCTTDVYVNGQLCKAGTRFWRTGMTDTLTTYYLTVYNPKLGTIKVDYTACVSSSGTKFYQHKIL